MSEVFYCKYLPTGAIVITGRTSQSSISLIEDADTSLLITNEEAIIGEDYVDINTLTVLPMAPVTSTTELNADTDAIASLTGLPDCTVNYYLGEYIPPDIANISATQEPIATDSVADGQLDISSDLAGAYTIVLSAPTSIESVVTFTVEDA